MELILKKVLIVTSWSPVEHKDVEGICWIYEQRDQGLNSDSDAEWLNPWRTGHSVSHFIVCKVAGKVAGKQQLRLIELLWSLTEIIVYAQT